MMAPTRSALTRLIPRPKDRRALAAGGVLIGCLLLTGRGVPAWREWERAERAAAEDSARRLENARANIDAHQSIIALRAVATRRLDSLSTAYLHASSPAIAGATLATLVGDLGGESGIRITSTTVRADSATKAAFTRITVRVSATGDVEGLADYLSSIESSEQLLAVRELSVAQSDPAAPDSRAEALHFELLIEALVRIDRGETPSSLAME
jgi:hypothetical protein